MTQHDCRTPRLSPDCCGDNASAGTETALAQSRVEHRADLSALMAVATYPGQVPMTPHVLTTVDTSPPHLSRIDLTTLLSTLII